MIAPFDSQPAAPVQLYPSLAGALPSRDLREGAYRVRFARNLAGTDRKALAEELRAVVLTRFRSTAPANKRAEPWPPARGCAQKC
jgi:hypothetical protein